MCASLLGCQPGAPELLVSDLDPLALRRLHAEREGLAARLPPFCDGVVRFSPHHASTGCARGSQCTGVLVHCARVRAGLVHGSSLRRTINPAPLLLCRKGILDKRIRRPAHLQFLNLEISKFRSERNVPSEICRVLAARESARETTFRRQRERATLSLAPSFALFRALALALAQ